MEKKELTIENKLEKLKEYLNNNKTNEKLLSSIYKILLIISPILAIVLFIAIFFTNNAKLLIILFLAEVLLSLIVIATISVKITNTDLKLAQYEITELDGLFTFSPMLFKENSNYYYLVFKLAENSQIYHCYRLDCEQIEKFKKLTKIENYIYLEKQLLTHKTDMKMNYLTLEQINLDELLKKTNKENED